MKDVRLERFLNKIRYHKWRLSHGRVVTGLPSKGTQRELSWVIMGLDNRDEKNKDVVIDHIDGNPKNNRKYNLRICTQGENIINKKSERQQHVKEEATLFKLHRKYNDNLLNYLNQEVYATNKERCEIIKTQYNKDKEKKKEEELQRKIQLRDQLKQRLMTESLLRDKAQLLLL